MAENSREQTSVPPLLSELMAVVTEQRGAFRQERTYQRAVALLMGEVWCFGRHTVSQALLALGLTDADWTAWYRLLSHGRFDAERAATTLLASTLAHVPAEAPYVMGVDGVSIGRSSMTMPGTSWLPAAGTAVFRRGLQRRQRFVHAAWLVPLADGYSRAIPLRLAPAFPPKAVPGAAEPATEAEVGVALIGQTRTQLDAHGRQSQPMLVLGDGSYDCLSLWSQLPDRTVAIVRTARNRKLFALPGPYAGRGRPRRYGPRARSPEAWLQERQGWQHCTVRVRGRDQHMVYRLEGPFVRPGLAEQPLYLVVVKGQAWRTRARRRRRKPAFYLVNAVPGPDGWQPAMDPEALLALLWQRWEVEVTHREMKSGFGVGEKQCWTERSTVPATQWTVWVYSLLALAGYRTWGLLGGPPTPARWWPGSRRWSWNTLWRSYRAAFWGCSDFQPLWSPSTNTWPKKEARIQSLCNAVAGAARA